MQKDCRSTSAELWDHDQVGLFFAETHLDLANHVWVVAVHNPADTPAATDGISRRKSLRRRSSVSARSSMNITNILASIAEEKDGESGGLGWHIDSVHSNSDAALIRAKRAWNEHFSEQGRCKKVREHYGFARYALKPTVTNKRELDYETCFQIRIERIKVASESEMRGELLAGQASNTCMVPLPMTHTARRDSYLCIDGQRSSFLEDILAIADRSFEPGFDYEELPLAFKIRHDHMMRWGSLTDQRYGHEARERNSSADLYHALLYKPELLDEQSKSKQPSQAYKISRQRMANALEQSDHADSIHQDARDTEPGTATMMVPREPARFPLRVRKRATASSRADSAIGLSETRGLNEDIELVDLEPKVPRQDEAGTKSLRVLHDTGKRVTTDTQFMKLAETASTPSGGPTV